MGKTLRKKRPVVLVVDDDPELRRLISKILRKKFRCHVIEAPTSHEALQIYVMRDDEIDYILTDSNMPEFDGIELCRHIRSNAELNQPPIIFVTASGDEDAVRDRIFDAHGNGIVTKPYRMRDLFEALRRTHTYGKEFFPRKDPHRQARIERIFKGLSRRQLEPPSPSKK